MNCVVINGTEVKGCTYHLKEIFLRELNPSQLTEFYFPKDAPDYCIGCKRCFNESETLCPHVEKVQPIWQAMVEADLIVFAYPVYVMRAPGHVKSFLDHLGAHFFAHRPKPVMFDKTAVILTQSIGAPNGPAQKDVVTSMEWIGVAKIERIGFAMMEGATWNEISEKRRKKFEQKLKAFARPLQQITPQKKSLRTKMYFQIGKIMQKSIQKKLSAGEEPSKDLQYWIDQGWISPRHEV